jgi:hypothetical protein
MKTYEGNKYINPLYLTSPIVGCESSPSCPCRFTTGEFDPSTHWIRGWLGPGTGLDDVKMRKKTCPHQN